VTFDGLAFDAPTKSRDREFKRGGSRCRRSPQTRCPCLRFLCFLLFKFSSILLCLGFRNCPGSFDNFLVCAHAVRRYLAFEATIKRSRPLRLSRGCSRHWPFLSKGLSLRSSVKMFLLRVIHRRIQNHILFYRPLVMKNTVHGVNFGNYAILAALCSFCLLHRRRAGPALPSPERVLAFEQGALLFDGRIN